MNWPSLEDVEREAIRQNLMYTNGDMDKTADILGVTKKKLVVLIGQHAGYQFGGEQKKK